MRMDDDRRIALIKSIGSDLLEYLADNSIDRETILNDRIVQWTITTPLYNIGEHVYCLSDAFKEAHPAVPWFKIAGMRHRLVHDCVDTNWSIVAEAVLVDVPAFIGQLDAL